ncbi:hypothetical protein L3X38_009962 [Prunus dulcis]|uniref:Retrovirus-related Pol polyprotein from transposon TNT 1-94-like beta-barrel domain-containing protein n=1 Tax=Prunus dulcis TaxID=3755 RepID=A0AAD4WGT3_PRUDU|nr:hypothetical protein L3X38_009962 [Prunus dulcis]
MKTFGEILINERLVQKVLISLSKPYDPICLVIENTKSLETVELQEVVAILKSQEQSVISDVKINGNWYIDSGCSSHMTGSAELLVDIRTNVYGKVQMPTRNLVDVAGIGSLVIETSVGKKYIREVMFLPGLKENLLCVGQMDEHGCYPLSIMQNDQIALRASVIECTWIWHKRLGHLNLRSLKQLRDQSMVHGLPYLEEINGVCEGCQLGKQHRDWFPKGRLGEQEILRN